MKKEKERDEMISIIMPVYNSEDYLEKSIQSVLHQTYTGFEFIIVDDGSTDKSWEICCKYAEIDARIKCYKVNNRGVSEARNFGLAHATKKYIRFVDSDDELPLDSLTKLIRPFIEYPQNDLVIGKFKATSHVVFNEEIEGEYSYEDFLETFSSHVPAFYYGVNWNKLYKRCIIEKNNIRFDKNVHWGEDFIFNCEYYSHCDYVYFLPEYIHIYCQRDESAVNAIKSMVWHEKLEIDIQRLETLLRMVKERECADSIIQKFHFYFFSSLSNQFSWAYMMKEKSLKERYEIFGMIIWNRKVSNIIRNFRGKDVPLFYRLMIFAINHKKIKLFFFIVSIKHIMGKRLWLKKLWNNTKAAPIHFEI